MCEKTYTVLCRVQNTADAFLATSHVAMIMSTGKKVRAYMQVLNVPTDWECKI
jgi:hypothetical protein